MLILKPKANKMPKTFLRVANGNIIAKQGEEELLFDTVTGMVKHIELRQHTFQKKHFSRWHIQMEDSRTEDVYDLSFGRTSGVFRTIIRCLASDEGLLRLNDIEIHVYRPSYGNYTNAVVYGHGKKLNWIPENVPPVLYRQVNGNTIADNSLRDEWLEGLVNRINESAMKTLPLDAPSIKEDKMDDIG